MKASYYRLIAAAAALLALLVLGGASLAQGTLPAIGRWVLGSGGGHQAGGNVSLDGTLGQPVVGPGAAGSTALTSGYWQGLPVLAVSKSDGLERWYAGWNYAYTIVIRNTGASAAAGLVVTDTLPAHMQVISLPAGATQPADGVVVWRPGDLDATGTLTLTLQVRTFSNVRGVITNTARVSYEGGPLQTANDATEIVAPPVNPTSTATPTLTPSATPTATRTATPSSTPTSSPTRAATATSTPTVTVTPSPGDLVLSGHIYRVDSSANAAAGAQRFQGIAGAQVSALLCLPRPYATISGADGAYGLIIAAADADACTEITIQVQAEGYETLQRTFLVSDLRAQPVRDLALTRLPVSPVFLPIAMR